MLEKLRLHKLKILAGVLGVLVFVGAVFGAYKFGQKQAQPTPQPTPTPAISSRLKQCDLPNTEGVYSCPGSNFKVVSKLPGGGFTLIDGQGKEIIHCGVVAPQYIDEKCKNLSCSSENLCELISIPAVSCGSCPQFVPPSPDFCKEGTIVPGEKDKCGCQTPPTCQRVYEEKPTVFLDKTNGRCQETDKDRQNVDIWIEESVIKFSGTIVETSPCGKLSADVGMATIILTYPAQKNISIFLTNEGYDGICVQCVGAIDFSGTVKGVSEGDYTVKIFLNAGGKTIPLGQKKVTLK